MSTASGRPRRTRTAVSGTVAVATVLAAVLLAGCGSGGTGASSAAAPATPGFPRTIEHALGTTELPAPPERLAALDSSLVDAAIALETPVVARTRYPAAGVDVPPYRSPAEQRFVAGARETGTLEAPDIEALYRVAPDLIVSAAIRHEQFAEQFRGVAPSVFTEDTGASWKENTRLLARALGKERLAEQKIGAYEQRARRIGDAVRAKLGRNPSVSLVRFMPGQQTVRLYSSDSFPGIVLRDLGFTRPPGQPDSREKVYVPVSQENIRQLDADRIFLAEYSDPRTTATSPRAAFESNPLWGTLRGVRTPVDDTTWLVSSSLLGAQKMLDDVAAAFGVDSRR